MTRHAGRRAGAAGTPRTRAAIVNAAREAFAAKGFAGATIRQIASAAAVDPALVLHYFRGKDQLFLAVLRGGVDPQRLLSDLFAADAQALGQQFVGHFLAQWEDGVGLTATALLRTAVAEERTAQLVREVVIPAAVGEMVRGIGVDPTEAPRRATLIAVLLSGLVTTRYILKLEPMASAPIEWVAAVLGPSISRYLTGELPELPTDVDQPANE